MIDYSGSKNTSVGARLEDGGVVISFSAVGLTQIKLTKQQARDLIFKISTLGIRSLIERE